jgi:hypothetical protein
MTCALAELARRKLERERERERESSAAADQDPGRTYAREHVDHLYSKALARPGVFWG